MAKFTVVKPIAVTVGQGAKAAVRHHRTPGEVVEIPEDQAAKLVEQGRVEPVKPPAERPKPRARTEGDAEG